MELTNSFANFLLTFSPVFTETSDDRVDAIGGLGMLIWQIEENGKLLDALRAWNQRADPKDHVRFTGFDAQDSSAAMNQLAQLLGKENSELQQRAKELIPRAISATQMIMAGERSEWEIVAGEIDELEVALKGVTLADVSRTNQYEL